MGYRICRKGIRVIMARWLLGLGLGIAAMPAANVSLSLGHGHLVRLWPRGPVALIGAIGIAAGDLCRKSLCIRSAAARR